MRNLVILISLLLAGCASQSIRHVEVEPKGEFATIQVEPSYQATQQLLKKDPQAIKRVMEQPDQYSPAVLCLLASTLFDMGRRDEAPLWFYLGQVRCRSDANKSLDPTAREGMAIVNQLGTRINEYAFRDLLKLERTVEDAVERDRQLPRNYDARWISLHGTGAFQAKTIRFEPKERWQKIDEDTRREYLASFRVVLDGLKSSKK